MSDEWKANCQHDPIDTVRLLRELDGGIYLLAKQADRGGGMPLSPSSCRSLCAWLTEHGFGPEVHAPPAQVDEREQQQAAVRDPRIGAPGWSVSLGATATPSKPSNAASPA